MRHHQQNRRRTEAQRRASLERRQYTSDADNPERRARQDRRRSGDRRHMLYAARFPAAGDDALDALLGESCQGNWAVVDDGITDKSGEAHLLVMFEREGDRRRFKALLAARGA